MKELSAGILFFTEDKELFMDRFALIKPEMWPHVMGPSLHTVLKK